MVTTAHLGSRRVCSQRLWMTVRSITPTQRWVDSDKGCAPAKQFIVFDRVHVCVRLYVGPRNIWKLLMQSNIRICVTVTNCTPESDYILMTYDLTFDLIDGSVQGLCSHRKHDFTRKCGNYSDVLPLKAARSDSISNVTSFGASNLSCRWTQCRFI